MSGDKPIRPESSDIAKKYVEAAGYNATAKSVARNGDPYWSRVQERVADKLAAPMHKPLTKDDVVVGVGSELALRMAMEPGDLQGIGLRDTVKEPELVTARATVDRLRMLDAVACVEVGLDTADTIQPRNSLERMLAHQMATAHTMAMRFMEKAQSFLTYADGRDGFGGPRVSVEAASLEATRLAGAAARMMASFQEGMATLAKVRSGGKQHVTVNHIHQNVQAQDGSQVVVAGKMKGRAGGRKRVRGRTGK